MIGSKLGMKANLNGEECLLGSFLAPLRQLRKPDLILILSLFPNYEQESMEPQS